MMRGETKTLFIIGLDHTIEQIQKAFNLHPDSMFVLQIYGPVITDPYCDLMRDVILSVYEQNVEEIYVVGAKDKPTNSVTMQDILCRIFDKKELQEQIEVIDYLFRTCKPEFAEATLLDWLEGSKTVADGVHSTVQLIQNHPLLPSDVNVHGIIMDTSDEDFLELEIS